MIIDEQLISHLEDLSCLTLTEDEKLRLTGDLGKILSGMARLNALSTENAPEHSRPFGAVNAFRQDEVTASLARELVLKNAPEHSATLFTAPLTVE